MPPKWRDKIPSSSKKVAGDVSSSQEEPPSIIMLVTGETSAEQYQWAYAKIPAENYLLFHEAEAKGNYNLSDYGEILKSGNGKEPPADVRDEMREKYDCDENFEETFTQQMEETIAAWDEAFKEEDNH